MTKKSEAKQRKDNKQDTKEKNKLLDYIITVVVIILVLAVAFFGLWKLSGEDKKPSKILVFTIGTEKVYQDEVNLCIIQNTIDLGVTAEHLNSATADDGTVAADYYKQQILDMIMDYKLEYIIAKEQGIALTEEEEKEVLLDVVEYMSRVDARVLNQWGITQELIEEVYTQRYLAYKLEESVTKDVSTDDLTYCTIYLMLFPKVEMTEDGNYATQEDGETPIMLSEEDILQRKEDAEHALEELKEGADVAEVAKKYKVEKYSGEESNTPESFGEPFSEYATTLKEGEYSPLIEVESCYAIMKMMTVNNEKLADEIRKYYQSDLEGEALEEKRAEWRQQLGIEKEPVFEGQTWEKISLYDYVQ